MPNAAYAPLPGTLRAEVGRFRDGLGTEWLGRLPGIVAECRQRWGLGLGVPYPYPSLSLVLSATRGDGSEAVLKVGFLTDELLREAEALRAYDGRGAVRLLDAAPDLGSLLLERVVPGDSLEALEDDDQATRAAAGVMRALWRTPPVEHSFPSIAEWAGGLSGLRAMFGGGTGPLPERLVRRAEDAFRDLLGSQEVPVLLHGDLQHYNILRAERAPWLAIDPKGVVGEPAAGVGPLLRNRLPDGAEAGRLVARRLCLLSELLGLDRERLALWSFAQAVLSAWWSVEDCGDWRGAIACAELLEPLCGCR